MEIKTCNEDELHMNIFKKTMIELEDKKEEILQAFVLKYGIDDPEKVY